MNETFTISRIIQLKTAFVSYNISRLRELIRYLPTKKYELFQNIPFWLHVNRPGVPGYVNSPHTPCGIYRFHDSGFWREVSKRYKMDERTVHRTRPGKDYILGVYLMGSSGTLAQTLRSDFDYWIVVDEKRVDAEGRAVFQEKLRQIEHWSRERYNQDVGLFLLDLADVRENTFAAVDDESSGSAQRTFLKEEFYRTFIMIAGKTPYWAVLPAGLDDAQYDDWVAQAARSRSLRFEPEDHLDLGGLTTIHRHECLGAILWQIFKSRKYPDKSLLKAGLIAHYFFFLEREGLLCDRIKIGYGGVSGSHLTDPYAVVFETVISFFEAMNDTGGLSLVKDCIFLRLYDGKKGGESPKQALLKQYLVDWSWDETKIKQLASYPLWPESDRLAFEEKIFNKLAFLYKLIVRAHDESGPALTMKASDLLSLKNSITSALKKKPGKLPRCSAHLRAHADEFSLQVSGHLDDAGGQHWAVYRGRSETLDARYAFFTGPGLLRTAGWLMRNGFYPAKAAHIRFQTFELPVRPKRVDRFVKEIHGFLADTPPLPGSKLVAPTWERVVVLLQASCDPVDSRLASADFLAVNSWGEFFSDTVDVAFTENPSVACFEIATRLWQYLENDAGRRLSYRLFQLEKRPDPRILTAIEKDLDVFRSDARVLRRPVGSDFPDASDGEDDGPYLDLL